MSFLPPIDAVTLPVGSPIPVALDQELDEIHEQLGVVRGKALAESLKPKLEVPMPQVKLAVAEPKDLPPDSRAAAVSVPEPPDSAAPGAEAAAEPPLLALPAPEDINNLITLDCSTGQAVTLDHLGPVVVNTDGTLARITNWTHMSEQERGVTKRRIAKRNIERLKVFRDRGDLKEDLVSALKDGEAAAPVD